MELIARTREVEKLNRLVASSKSEFLAVYGRRRVGKTYLVRAYFENQLAFYCTGLARGNTKQQLTNFTVALNNYFGSDHVVADNWFLTFNLLIRELRKKSSTSKQVLFIDEMPWMDTKRSDFMMGLEYFWNSWASAQPNILLVVCGSAATWMIHNLIRNTGGLYNRVTERIKLEPFSLKETEAYFESKGVVLDRHQIIQLYMVMGGIPHYLDQVKPGKSAMQIIDDICFKDDGLLRNEFQYIFSSLFRHSDKHDVVLRAIYDKGGALTREALTEVGTFTSGGSLTKLLNELTESGFITSFQRIGQGKSRTVYCISDFYTLFYFRFIAPVTAYEPNMWLNNLDNPAIRAWSGFAFEQICFAHITEIKEALQIGGVSSTTYSWFDKGNSTKKGSQIDLVIDRRDQVINLFEIKFSINEITITKEYDAQLRHKISSFKEATETKKSVFLTLMTTHGLKRNEYAGSTIQNELTMDALFR
jgi:uncharacterized protein